MRRCEEANLVISGASEGDHEFLHRLNRSAYEDLATRLFGTWDDLVKRERLAAKIEKGQYQVITQNGTPIGAFWCSGQVDHLFVHDLMLLPDVQRGGLGSRVLLDLVDRSCAAGLPLRLHTSVHNAAHTLYRRLGFIETGRDADFIDFEHPP